MQPSPLSRTFWLACAFAAALVLAAHAGTLHNAFQFDDDHVIVHNPALELSNVPRFFVDARTFSSYPPNATYRPLLSVTLAFDKWRAGGLDPVPFHVTQLALLAALGVALYFLAKAAFSAAGPEPWHRWAGLSVATLFCVHGGNTQVVSYLSARSELLCALGVVGGFLVWRQGGRAQRWHLYLVPVALGALAKTPAVVFGVLLLAWLVIIERRGLSALRSALPALLAGALLFLFVEGMNPPGQTYGGGGRLQYLWTQASLWPRYLRVFLWPSGLSADSDLRLLPDFRHPAVALGVGLALASLVAVVLFARRPALRPAAFGLTWFWVCLAPTSSVFPLAEVTNDHRPFLGFIGLSLAAVCLGFVAARAWAGRTPEARLVPLAATGLFVAALVGHAVASRARARVWRDAESLWSDVVVKSPRNARGWMNLAVAKMARGDYAAAKTLLGQAEALAPQYAFIALNQALVAAALNEPDAARAHFVRATELEPGSPRMAREYGEWLVKVGRGPEAVEHLERARKLDPSERPARALLAQLARARGDDAAAQALERELAALGWTPPAEPGFDAARRFAAEGRHADAAAALRAVVQQSPDRADAWNELGWSLQQLGWPVEAIDAYAHALALSPAWALAKKNLMAARFEEAFRLQQQGKLREAAALYRQLLKDEPEYPNARFNLIYALLAAERCDEAVPELERALEQLPTWVDGRERLEKCRAASAR